MAGEERGRPGAGGRAAAASGLVWVLLESAGVSLLSLATLLVLARLIGPAELGMAGLALSIVQVLYLLAEMLFHDAVVQRRDLDDVQVDSAVWAAMLVGSGLAAGCWLAAPAVEAAFAAPGLAPVLSWMGLSLVFGGANGVMTALLRRDMRFKRVAARSLFGRLLGAGVGLGLALSGYGVWALVAQQVAVAAGASLALWLDPPRRPRLRLDPAALWRLLAFALPAVSANLLFQASLRLFVLAVGWLLGPTAVGHLTIALRVVDTARMILASGLQQLVLPLFSRRQDDRAALGRGYRAATELTALVTQPLFAGLLALAPEVVHLLLGPGWEPAVPLVQVLCLVAMAQLARQFANAALLAVGRPRLLAVQNGVGLLVTLGLLALFGREGELAAVLVWAARFAILLPANAWILRREAGISWRDQFGPVAVPVAAAVLMAAILIGLRVGPLASLPDLRAAVLMIPAGALLYVGMVALMDRGLLGRLAGFALMVADRGQPRRV